MFKHELGEPEALITGVVAAGIVVWAGITAIKSAGVKIGEFLDTINYNVDPEAEDYV